MPVIFPTIGLLQLCISIINPFNSMSLKPEETG
jgi:hypothetical protein